MVFIRDDIMFKNDNQQKQIHRCPNRKCQVIRKKNQQLQKAV